MRSLSLALAAVAAVPALAAAGPASCVYSIQQEAAYLATGTAPTLRYVLQQCDDLLGSE